MELISNYLSSQGIKNFNFQYLFITTGEEHHELTEFIVSEDGFCVCERDESLWGCNSSEDTVEFTLFQAHKWTHLEEEEIGTQVFFVPKKDLQFQEINYPKRIVNILNKEKLVFSIQGEFEL